MTFYETRGYAPGFFLGFHQGKQGFLMWYKSRKVKIYIIQNANKLLPVFKR